MNLPILIIVLGCVIFIIAFLGCCGAWLENRFFIYSYCMLVIIVLIAQVVACFAAFLFQGSLKAITVKNMYIGMENYNTTGYDGVTLTWDMVQSELKCCGVQNWQDWKNVKNGTQFNDGSVPDSCCIEKSFGCGRSQVSIGSHEDGPAGRFMKSAATDVNLKINSAGCFDFFVEVFVRNRRVIGGVAIGIAVGEVIAIAFACYLGKNVGR